MQSDIVQCSLCAKLSPNMEQTAARTAAQIGCTMQCRECGRTYETQAAEITRLTEALRAAEEREKGLREALGFIEAKAANFIQAVDRYNEEHGEFIGGAPIFQLAKAVGVARQALAGAKP